MIEDLRQLKPTFRNRETRFANYYKIVDKYGQIKPFKLNWAQKELNDSLHNMNIILKARQLGMSSFISIIFLDACLFQPNISAGIIAHTKEDAQQIFKKIRFAYDNLPSFIRYAYPATSDSVRELAFPNGSSIRVGTSLRSQTFQYLHISEFGYICAHYRDKAQEIISGSLNTVAPGQHIFIESTAEGKEGYFYEMCQHARFNQDITNLDFKFHFFPWWRHPDYLTDKKTLITNEYETYFEELKAKNIHLKDEQKWWYIRKAVTQQDSMKREYPSTPDEAFEESSEGFFFIRQMNQARLENRITNVPYEAGAKTFSAWDLGYDDYTAVFIYQIISHEIHLIDYIEGNNLYMIHYIKLLKEKPYVYSGHYVPPDANVTEYTTGLTRVETAAKHDFVMTPLPQMGKADQWDNARMVIPRCWFDEAKCALGIKRLETYKKKWDERLGRWSQKEVHDDASHGADAFMYLCQSLPYITGSDNAAELDKQLWQKSMGMQAEKSFFNTPSMPHSW
ncbi:MAG: terminase [Candidatus Bathyarchaeota archaeon]